MHTRSLRAAFALTLAVAGCNAPPSEPTASAPSPQKTGPRVNDIAWPEESRIDRDALLSMPEPARESVRASRVPVLVPSERAWLEEARVLSKEHWTVASGRIDSATVTVTATRVSHKVRGVDPVSGNRDLRDARGFVTRNEGIWSASWKENRISYSVEIECDSPSDSQCLDEASLLGLVQRLTYVGGGEEVAR